MSKSLINELDELTNALVITPETADRIRAYYREKESKPGGRVVIVFGILGSLLVGMGIILIIAHNWDDLGKAVKLGIAFLPLVLGQAMCGYLLLKRSESTAWREGSATFLLFAIATSISIVSQVYNIHGNLARFLLVWMLLSAPLIYAMRSSMVSMLFLIGITWYACEVSYFHYLNEIAWAFWPLLAVVVPWYVGLIRTSPNSNFTYFHHWLVTASLTIVLGMFADQADELIMLAYLCLFGIFILIGQFRPFAEGRTITNAYLVSGSLGSVILMLTLSFEWYWQEIERLGISNWIPSIEMLGLLVLAAIAGWLLYRLTLVKKPVEIHVTSYVFLAALVLYVIGSQQPETAQVLTNVIVLAMGVFTIRRGGLANRLGILNYGLLIISALIVCRFFDTDLSFVVRGILFVLVGVGFFAANYWMVQRRKKQAES